MMEGDWLILPVLETRLLMEGHELADECAIDFYSGCVREEQEWIRGFLYAETPDLRVKSALQILIIDGKAKLVPPLALSQQACEQLLDGGLVRDEEPHVTDETLAGTFQVLLDTANVDETDTMDATECVILHRGYHSPAVTVPLDDVLHFLHRCDILSQWNTLAERVHFLILPLIAFPQALLLRPFFVSPKVLLEGARGVQVDSHRLDFHAIQESTLE